MSIKINYFDLGLYDGAEISMMLKIFNCLKIDNYNVFGFEAHPEYSKNCTRKYKDNDRIKIVNAAISSKEGSLFLYLSPNLIGHSIYSTKNNVSPHNKIEVKSIVFSEWVKKNISDICTSFNILKVNIEGAELNLLRDFDKNKFFQYFHIYCGAWRDIIKIKELKNNIPEFDEILSRNKINIYRFCTYNQQNNANMTKIIKEAIDKYAKESV